MFGLCLTKQPLWPGSFSTEGTAFLQLPQTSPVVTPDVCPASNGTKIIPGKYEPKIVGDPHMQLTQLFKFQNPPQLGNAQSNIKPHLDLVSRLIGKGLQQRLSPAQGALPRRGAPLSRIARDTSGFLPAVCKKGLAVHQVSPPTLPPRLPSSFLFFAALRAFGRL